MRIVTKEPEAHLIELLQLVDENRSGWQAIAFNFANLLEHYRSEYQIKIATNLMNDLLGDRDGAVYQCEDSTIYVMVRNFPRQLLEKMIFQLRYLFMDDPLSYTPEGDENPEFCTIYDIENSWQDMLDAVKRRLVARVRKTRAVDTPVIPVPQAAPKQAVPKNTPLSNLNALRRDATLFTGANLATIERDLREVDLTGTIRRQPVCAVTAEQQIRTVFDEMYIHINQLRTLLRTEVDLLSNRWLFKYLTQMLDARMLDTIQRNPARYLTTPISLNLNIPTLLSTRFAEFDAAIKPSAKVSIVIELQIADVFVDMGAFLAAKDTVQKLGYRVCLDGVSNISFPQIDRQRLGFDLIKLIWNGDSKTDATSEKNQRLLEAMQRCGTNRVILSRCDNQSAIEFGQSLGITLFQGRHLDTTINPKAAVVN